MATLEKTFVVDLPVANPLRFTLDGVLDNQRAKYDQVRFSKAEHATMESRMFEQLYEQGDPTVRVQFYTNYPKRRVRVFECGNPVPVQTFTPLLAKQYIGKKYRSDCKITGLGGFAFIYFDSGVVYSDPDFTVQDYIITLKGVKPNINAAVGDVVRYKIEGTTDFITGTITEIAWNVALQVEGFKLSTPTALTEPVGGLTEIAYNDKPTNLYYAEINLAGLTGRHYVTLEFGKATHNVVYTSEPINVQETHEETLLLGYRHVGDFSEDDLYSYLYLLEWFNYIRVPSNFCEIVVGGEVETYTDDFGKKSKSRAVPLRQINFKALNITGWMIDKFNVVFGHDRIFLNGYYWESENFGNYDAIDFTDIGSFEILLIQTDDRTKYTTETEDEITAEFTPDEVIAVDFEGDTFTVLFESNTEEDFTFDELPDWLEADKETFKNGDMIEFTVSENETAFDRSVTLVASAVTLPGLLVELPINQTHDTVEDDYIAVPAFEDVSPFYFESTAHQSQIFDVSASGPFTAVSDNPTEFAVTILTGNKIKIEAVSANPGLARDAVIKVALVSSPSVDYDCYVVQKSLAGSKEIISATPSLILVPFATTTTNVAINVANFDTGWQPTKSVPWINVSSLVRVGDQTIAIQSTKNTSHSPRTGYVTITNVGNPADTVVITVTQSAAP